MERLNALAEGLKHVARLLSEDVLEPDAARGDWARLRVRVNMVREGMDKVLGGVEGALEEAEDADSKGLVRQRVAEVAGRVAALLLASGEPEGFQRFLDAALALAEDPAQRAKLEAGRAEPEGFRLHEHAVWAVGRGRSEVAQTLFTRLARQTRQQALKARARDALQEGSRPVDKAPPLVRVNGCGTGLYGRRDEWPDGSYVTTYFISLVFLPVVPLTAYRVRDVGRAYEFHSREPLGPVTRVWQRLSIVGFAVALLASAVTSYLHAPGRRARLALEDAQTAEDTLSREEALERYLSVIDEHRDGAVRARATDAVIRLSLAGLPTPCTRGAEEGVGRMVERFATLPTAYALGASGARVAERLDECAREIGEDTPENARAALAVVEAAERAVPGHLALRARREVVTRALADELVKERPLSALALYAGLPGPEARDAARALLDTLGEAPSLWLEAAGSVEAWLARGDLEGTGASRYRERLARARTAHARDEALIQEGDEVKLRQALKSTPGDQEVAVAVAHRELDRGDVTAASAHLEALGPVGQLTGEARLTLAACRLEQERWAEADAAYSAFVDERLVPLQRAREEYERREEVLEQGLAAQSREGRLPREVDRRLKAARDEQAQAKVFQEWRTEALEQDSGLRKLREAYLRQQQVVSPALTLGRVRLQRAQAAEGEARRALLSEAERVFLAIQPEADDNPRFHQGLGQVYHLQGRTEEGDAELEGGVEREGAAR